MSRAPITAKGAARLRAELEELKSVKRPAVIAAIAEARAHGDLKENAEYHAAREQQSFIEGRIKLLEGELSHANVIDVATLPSFAAPDEALGDDLFEHIPAGAEGRRWRSLLSETQVVLHNHPHNVWRQSVGKPPVNSRWFWGGGVLPHAVTWTAPTLYSDDPCLLGLALAGNIQGMPLDQCHGFDDDALVDVRALRDPHRIIGDWLQPALSAAAGKDVCLDFADGAVFRLAASQRWRFWRRCSSRSWASCGIR